MKPGIYYDMPDAEYRAISAWSPSTIANGLTSMLQLKHSMSHPKESTEAMTFGSAIHTSILEPDLFPLRYVLWDGGRRAGQEWKEFVASAGDKVVLRRDQYTACLAARDAVRKHPVAKAMLAGAKTEVSIIWNDPETGLLCKGRADIVGSVLGDVKTTAVSVADDRALKRVASQFHYDMRMAAYHAGLSMFGYDALPVKLAFVEQRAPHDVRVKTLSLGTLAKGWDKWMSVLRQIPECERTGIWPGCDDGESELEFWGGDSLDITLDGELI